MKITIQEMTKAALFATLLAISAFIKLPITIVPVTLQTLMVMVIAFSLPTRQVAFSVGLYLLTGLAGLPVFASGGGIAYVLQPSFGYLIAFFIVGISLSYASKWIQQTKHQIMLSLLGLLAIYIIGIGYFLFIQANVYHLSFDYNWVLQYLVYVFIVQDSIACILAVYIAKRLQAVNRFHH